MGLMDKTAVFGLAETEDRAELVFREGLEPPWRAVDVADNPMVDQLLHVRSFCERVRVQELHDERAIELLEIPPLDQFFVREHAAFAAQADEVRRVTDLGVDVRQVRRDLRQHGLKLRLARAVVCRRFLAEEHVVGTDVDLSITCRICIRRSDLPWADCVPG